MKNSVAPSRRSVAKSVAWTVPVIAVGTAAPAASASTTATPPGLQGWVQVTETCDARTGARLGINGAGSYPDRGLWVYNTTPATTITNASITFYFPTTMNLTWSYASGGSTQWTLPTKDPSAPAVTGMTAYTTRYTGAFAYVKGNPVYSYALGQPAFQTQTLSYSYCLSAVRAYARRTVTVDGKQISFLRGPITLQPSSAAPRANTAATVHTTGDLI